jgi:hypothetical protein
VNYCNVVVRYTQISFCTNLRFYNLRIRKIMPSSRHPLQIFGTQAEDEKYKACHIKYFSRKT